LDLWSLVVDLSVSLDFSHDGVVSWIVVLGEAEQFADLGGPLGSEPIVDGGVREARDLLLALLQNDQVEDGDIRSDFAASNGFALPLTLSARAVARVTFC